jgi:hypothetical protein
MKRDIDKALINLSAQVNIENYVIIMNWPTMKKFLAELTDTSDKDCGEYVEVEELIEYRGHKLVYDFVVKDDQFVIINWNDYARERDLFNKRMGLHL